VTIEGELLVAPPAFAKASIERRFEAGYQAVRKALTILTD